MNKYKGKSNITGKMILEARLEKGLSLEKLSNKLQLLDVILYPNDIFLIENEKRILKDFELFAISKILDINIENMKNNIK